MENIEDEVISNLNYSFENASHSSYSLFDEDYENDLFGEDLLTSCNKISEQ